NVSREISWGGERRADPLAAPDPPAARPTALLAREDLAAAPERGRGRGAKRRVRAPQQRIVSRALRVDPARGRATRRGRGGVGRAARAAFIEARERDYAALAEEAAKLLEAPARRRGAARATRALATAAQRLRRRRLELEEIDYFSAPGGFALERLIERL